MWIMDRVNDELQITNNGNTNVNKNINKDEKDCWESDLRGDLSVRTQTYLIWTELLCLILKKESMFEHVDKQYDT